MRLTRRACLIALLLAGAAAAHAAEAPAPHVFTSEYPVGPVLGRLARWFDAQGLSAYYGDRPLEVTEFLDALERVVNRESDWSVAAWSDAGGRGEARVEGRTLVVSQTAAGHARVTELLDLLARALPAPQGLAAKPTPLARTQPVMATPESEANAAVRRALARPMDVSFEKTPLGDVLKYLDQATPEFQIQATPALAAAGIDLATRVVTLDVRGVPTECILEEAVGPALAPDVREGRVVIMPVELLHSNLALRLYPVEDLLGAWQDAGAAAYEAPLVGHWEGLIYILQRCVNNFSDPRVAAWGDEGGPAAVDYLAGVLLVTQTPRAHDRIAGVLDALRTQGDGAKPIGVADTYPGFREAARRRLETRVDVDADNASVSAALQAVRKSVPGLNLVVADAVASTGIDLDTCVVTLRLKDVPARVALDAMLPEDLAWRIEPGYVLVTTADEGRRAFAGEVHGVGGLLKALEPWREYEYQHWESVIDVIQRSVNRCGDPAVAAWNDEGGPAAIEFLSPDRLILTQTPRGLERTRALLATLRQAMAAARDSAGEPTRDVVPVPDPVREAGRRRLEKPVSVALVNTPLAEALATVAALRPDLNLRVDAEALEEAGVDLSARRVMIEVGPRPLADLLDRMLPPEMGYAADEGSVVVGPRELTWRRMPMVIYAAADLLPPPEPAAPPWQPAPLAQDLFGSGGVRARRPDWGDRIQKRVRPEDGAAPWADEGGPAQIEVFGPLLIVTQTPRGQEGVQKALDRLRQERKRE